MKRSIVLTVCAISLATSALGQYVRINDKGSKSGLYFNLDRLWAYNIYEASRWGGGLRYDLWLGDRGALRTLSLEGYVGYGYSDQRLKWGLQADLQSRLKGQPHLFGGYFRDLTHDASRRIDRYSLSALTANFDFMARRFSETDRFYFGLGGLLGAATAVDAEVRYSRERRLFDQNRLFYPASPEERDEFPLYRLLEFSLAVRHKSGLRGELTVGGGHNDAFGTRDYFGTYGRLLVQWDTTLYRKHLYLHPYVQAGATTRGLPYSRHFDLGGTSGSPLLFSRALATAQANEFTANLFGLLSVKAGFRTPLFKLDLDFLSLGLCPRPFVVAGAAWGRLWDEDEEGLVWHDNIEMQSPSRGIAEAGVGIDGILRIGAVDWGAALVWRLVPPSAPYRLRNKEDNLTLLFTAVLVL
ncbi:MAG: hypothetical protein J6I49_09630 [Bacteroidales bacterium]|nr:hypothetical protein [Bacteroidales bacterium]